MNKEIFPYFVDGKIYIITVIDPGEGNPLKVTIEEVVRIETKEIPVERTRGKLSWCVNDTILSAGDEIDFD